MRYLVDVPVRWWMQLTKEGLPTIGESGSMMSPWMIRSGCRPSTAFTSWTKSGLADQRRVTSLSSCNFFVRDSWILLRQTDHFPCLPGTFTTQHVWLITCGACLSMSEKGSTSLDSSLVNESLTCLQGDRVEGQLHDTRKQLTAMQQVYV